MAGKSGSKSRSRRNARRADRAPEQEVTEEPLYGIHTSRQRAAEIALMNEFGITEFIELTGVGLSDYGIYRVTKDGVRVGVTQISLN